MKWLEKVMDGRTGVDHYSMFLLIIGIILQLVLQLLPWPIVMLAYIPTLTAVWRTFSKNKIKRHQENIKFLKYWYPIQSKWTNKYRGMKAKFKDKKQYRYFKCKTCKQKLRVPKTAKRVQITCPKCRNSFVKETFGNKMKRTLNKQ